jgi:predicted phage terminase large subunit-like protein
MQAGHSQKFVEDEFGSVVRDIVGDARFSAIFPGVLLNPRQTAAGSWGLDNRRGRYVCKGVGQKIAGYRGHIGGCDDIIGSKEDADSALIREKTWKWLWADFRTRLLPRAPFFLIATRWDPDDPIGRIEEMNRKGIGLPWRIVNVPMLIENERDMALDPMGRGIGEVMWPGYYDVAHVLELKATMDARDWNALYQGRPRNAEGNLVKTHWIDKNRYTELPRNTKNADGSTAHAVRRITLSVDTASKKEQRHNPTALTVWIETYSGDHYIAEGAKKKVEINELVTFIEGMAEKWHVDQILVEDKGNGTAYIQLRQGKAPAPIIPVTPEAEGNKWNRFDKCAPLFESGKVHLPKQAPWLTDYENEILAFPSGTDDYVDSTSQYLIRHSTGRRKGGTRKLKGAATR